MNDNTTNAPQHKAAEEDHEAERIAAHVKKIVDAWPPLTEEQKSRIAILLRGSRSRR